MIIYQISPSLSTLYFLHRVFLHLHIRYNTSVLFLAAPATLTYTYIYQCLRNHYKAFYLPIVL